MYMKYKINGKPTHLTPQFSKHILLLHFLLSSKQIGSLNKMRINKEIRRKTFDN